MVHTPDASQHRRQACPGISHTSHVLKKLEGGQKVPGGAGRRKNKGSVSTVALNLTAMCTCMYEGMDETSGRSLVALHLQSDFTIHALHVKGKCHSQLFFQNLRTTPCKHLLREAPIVNQN